MPVSRKVAKVRGKKKAQFLVLEDGKRGLGDNGGPAFDSWGEKGPNPAQRPATALLASRRHVCLVGGARSGKTTAIVRAICYRAMKYPKSRHVILRHRAVYADASIGLDTLPKVMSSFFKGQAYKHVKSPHNLIRFPNGSEIWIAGLDDSSRVDKILGAEYATIFLNECSQISWYAAKLVRSRLAQVIEGCPQRMWYDINPVGKSHWTNLLFGEKVDPETKAKLTDPDSYGRMFVNPDANRANLSAEYIAELENSTGNYRKRFFEGVYIDEVNGALWTIDLIEAVRLGEDEPEPEYVQTVVVIDPSGASEEGDKSDVEKKPKNDEIGIIVASLGKDQRVYLRKDLSTICGPIGHGINPATGLKNAGWADIAIAAYHAYGADSIIAEVNYGGGMVEAVIKAQDSTVPVRVVRASSGKHIRAEPIATVYQNDGVRHVGRFPELEDQLTQFTTLGYGGAKSPDRADAWIWAVTELALQNGAANWIEYYRRLSEANQAALGTAHEPPPAPAEGPQFGFKIAAKADTKHRVKVPHGISTLYLIDGSMLNVPADQIVEVSKEDAAAFGARGWERL
jgi:phage terminase large subunit-like protein